MDITNQKFGSLTALYFSHKDSNHNCYWVYQCQCGKLHTARANTIKYEAKKKNDPELPSCGCVEKQRKTKHGFRTVKNTHPLYKVWHGIKSRCYNTNNPEYIWYGAKGVTMCEEWLDSPENFIEWGLTSGYKKGLHIDKDILCNQKDIKPHIYSPETCLWVSAKQNVSEATSRKNFGKHPNIRLSQEQVNEILDYYFSGTITNMAELARMYGLKSNSSILRLIRLEKERRANSNDIS